MKSLVTGAFGFAGQHLVRHLLESGDEVIGTYIGDKPDNPPCEARELEITNPTQCNRVISEVQPEVIYHLAAIAFVPEAEKNFDLVQRINVGGTYNVAQAAVDLKEIPKFVFVSSSEVYGKIRPEQLPITETTELRPHNNYCLSKLMAEQVVRKFENTHGLPNVILRPFNHIGPEQRDVFVVSSFAHQLALIARGKSDGVIRVGNLKARRDFTDVRDIARAYRKAAIEGSGVFNLCSGTAVPIDQMLQMLIDIAGIVVSIERDPDRMRPSEVPELRGSFDRAREAFGWQPEYHLRQSLEDTYRYWLEVESERKLASGES